MLNNGFRKRKPYVRQAGPPYKLIDYLKTVEFHTLKTSQFKKRKGAKSKRYTIMVQRLHMSRMFYIGKF